jgi:hypothetical protein
MPVERYPVGRKYTKRNRIYISPESIDTEEGAAALAESLREMAKGATLEGRLASTIQWATATLECAGLPLDPSAPIYSDRAWLRENAYQSAAWYAITILETFGWLRTFRERGDTGLALNLALELGVLATEARLLKYMSRKAVKMAQAKASKQREKAAEDLEKWRREADKKWDKHQLKSAADVARLIDRARAGTIRKKIADLKPPKGAK